MYVCMYVLYTHLQHHNDTIIKMQWQRRRKTPLTIFTSHFIARVRKGCVGFYCERELEIEHNCNILTPHSYGRHVVSFFFSWCSTGGLGAHSAGWSATSYQQLLRTPNSIGVPECGFPYHILSPTGLELQLATPLARRTQLNYIIVRRPLDLWNRMFYRHQTEITVMQFRGHSLPVHQSMSVPWEFLSSSHFISQFPPTQFPHITAIGMFHFLPVHHLEWHFARAEGQNITYVCILKNVRIRQEQLKIYSTINKEKVYIF